MKNPGFHIPISLLGAILIAFTGGVRAEPPSSVPAVQASKSSSRARTKPQVIYHVRPASNYAATLHSQEKTRNNDLPVDNEMPSSLQLSRSNANEAAAEANARAQQEAAAKKRAVTRPKVQKQHHSVRPPGSMKSKGHGKGHKH